MMIQRKRVLILLLAFFLLPACSTTQKYFVEMPYTIKSKVKTCEVIVAYSEQNITVEIPREPVYAGLIMDFIGEISRGAEKNEAEKFLPIIRQEIKEIEVGSLMKEEVTNTLQKTKWVEVQKIHLIGFDQQPTLEAIRAKSQTDVVMIVALKGVLNSQFETLTGILSVEMYPVSERICSCIKVNDPKKTPIYKRNFVFAESLPIPEGEREENAKQWTRNNGEIIKKAMRGIVGKLTKQLQADLNREH